MTVEYSLHQVKTCPHLGEKFQPLVKPQLDNPYPFYQLAREAEPIFYSPVFDAYVLTRYDDILSVLKDPVKFSSTNSLQAINNYAPEVIEILSQGFPFISLISSDGELHKRLRTPLIKAFAPDKLKAMEGFIYAIANRLVDSFIGNGCAEILSEFAYPLTLETIFTMYNVPLEKMAQVKQCGSSTTSLFSSHSTPEQQIKYARDYVALQHVMADLVEQHRQQPANNFISEVLENSDLNTGEIVSLLCEMVLAGHKTTANLIGNSLKILLEHPQLWQKICHEQSLIPAVLEEVLRYDTPAPSMSRISTEEVSLAGMILPKGSRILMMYASAHHDESHFSNSEMFELERFQDTTSNHIAFGHGMHHCTGSNLARREARIALEVLTQRLPNLKLRPNQEFARVPAMLNRGYVSLELEWNIA
ncbi:cytochrome P450 like protein [Calothrix sp. NIES-4101]|nr:cytochrome P450 like protein [Calothrix sp. NIES-4101]